MTKKQLKSLSEIKESLHISHSQVFCYLNCSLKYMFSYVQGRPPERISVALPFGKSIHFGIEHYYRTWMEKKEISDVKVIEELFTDCFSDELNKTEAQIIYKKDENKDSSIDMGKAMLRAFCKSVNLKNIEVIGVEMPLNARLYNEKGQPTDFNLIGVIDALIKDENGILIAIDHKTASKIKQKKDLDEELQFSAYAYLLSSNRIVGKADDVQCRMDVIRKLKRPKMEYYSTIRTSAHRRRFAKIACKVLEGIEHQVFFPSRSWMCSDCQYSDACKNW